ncbi:MAG: hypothetical protein RLZZ210_1580 [Pseudomonadota bacterium]
MKIIKSEKYPINSFVNNTSKLTPNIIHSQAKIIGIFSESKVGDKSQALGILDEIQQLPKLTYNSIERVEFPITNSNELIKIKNEIIQDLIKGKQVILVMSGFSINLSAILKDIKQDLNSINKDDLYKNIISVATSHEMTHEFLNNQILPTITSLPITSLNIIDKEHIQKLTTNSNLERTFGVAHDLSDLQIKKKCELFEQHSTKAIPEINKQSILLVLGGDYQAEDGTWHNFSKEEAINLTKSICIKHLQDGDKLNFVLLDSPRTGVCSEDGKLLETNPHKAGIVNEVIKAVEDVIKSYNCTVETFSLMLNQKTVVSALAPALQKFAKHANYKDAIVTGESTTMVTQLFGILPKMTVACISSMNMEHKNYVDELFRLGIINIIDNNGNFSEHNSTEIIHITPASKQIASAVEKYI